MTLKVCYLTQFLRLALGGGEEWTDSL